MNYGKALSLILLVVVVVIAILYRFFTEQQSANLENKYIPRSPNIESA